MVMISYFYLVIRHIRAIVSNHFSDFYTKLLFLGNRVKYSSFKTNGIPYIMVARGGRMSIGKDFRMNNGLSSNPIGCPQKCTLFVHTDCDITIGNNVGISQTALISHSSIKIGNNVKIGGGTSVYTTDFHSLDPIIRVSKDDQKHRKSAPVVICDNVFIGAKCIILKGVTIGENSVIGAGSVVTKNVPANQIWAGNPAKFIKNV